MNASEAERIIADMVARLTEMRLGFHTKEDREAIQLAVSHLVFVLVRLEEDNRRERLLYGNDI